MASRIVIALGGNALGDNAQEQQARIADAAPSLVGLISQGYEIILTHGNGPQVGTINLAFAEGAKKLPKIPVMPMPECTAMSQGYIGYHLQKGIVHELRAQKMPWHVASMVTQVVVDPADSAFQNPTKPIGGYYSEEEAKTIMEETGQVFAPDANRGWRRMVPSPMPVHIVERDSILNLLDNEFVVIACGGGGVPVIRRGSGDYEGVDAVIDKDFSAALLAQMVDAEYLFILTAVERVAINFGRENQREIEHMTTDQARRYCDEGHFAAGSMLPKVRAAIKFAESKHGRKCVIAALKKAPLAIRGESGTMISM
ncbi:MAG: carbamate kinase [Clostridia bacterium]|nr:carbamate kinase [Clostridia bacterium]